MIFSNLATFLENVLRVLTNLSESEVQSFYINSWKENEYRQGNLCGTTHCVLGYCVEDDWFREHIFKDPLWKEVRNVGFNDLLSYRSYVPIFREDVLDKYPGLEGDSLGVFGNLLLHFLFLLRKDIGGKVAEINLEILDIINDLCFTEIGCYYQEYSPGLIPKKDIFKQHVFRVEKCLEAVSTASDLNNLVLKLDDAASTCFSYTTLKDIHNEQQPTTSV